MKKYLILLAAVFSLFFFSCQKEADFDIISNNGNSEIDLSGTWKFVNSRVKTLATNEVTATGNTAKTVTTSDYTTENNTGTVVFNSQSMSYDSLSYSINTIARGTLYNNGVLLDTFSMPLQFTIPATKGQTPFTRITSDSLNFQGATSIFNNPSQTTRPSGVKIKREQDKLYLTQKVNESSITTDQGQTMRSNQQAEVVIILQKK